jgi:hypothetical protein
VPRKNQPTLRQPVEVGRADFLLTVETHLPVPKVIRENKHEIGTRLKPRGREYHPRTNKYREKNTHGAMG